WNRGRSVGKLAAGLRVVRVGGDAEGFLTAAVRNFLRIVDFLPAFYVVGVTSILATSRNQRLGDLAAGTIVVRERRPAGTPAAPGGGGLPRMGRERGERGGRHYPPAVPRAPDVAEPRRARPPRDRPRRTSSAQGRRRARRLASRELPRRSRCGEDGPELERRA